MSHDGDVCVGDFDNSLPPGLAGRGYEIAATDGPLVELTAWVAHRCRRVLVQKQLLAQVDHCFPGLSGALSDVLGAKVRRLVVAEFADPARLANLGVDRFRAYAAGCAKSGKPGGIIGTALARRATKIAFAMVRAQTLYDPTAWQHQEG